MRLVPGKGNEAVLEFRTDQPRGRKVGTNLVIALENHQIVSMTEYRWTRLARRLAHAA